MLRLAYMHVSCLTTVFSSLALAQAHISNPGVAVHKHSPHITFCNDSCATSPPGAKVGCSSFRMSCLQVNVGKGTNSIHGHDAPVRDVVLHFLQHLVPVKLAARNDGLITVRRVDMLKMFKTMQAQQMPCDASTFHDCFTASQQESGHLQDLMKRL